MTWTATTCDNLKYALPVGGATLELASAAGTTDLCLLIGTPAARHVVLEVYTASGSETVVAYGCDGGAVQVTRANGGTTQLSWPVGACVRTVQIIEGALCGTEAPTDECCSVSTVWGGLTVCPELELDLSVPSAPRLCLKPSGVAAGDRCGGRLKVDTYGRVTYMSLDFPQACLPVFDPCACGGSGGGGTGTVTADDVLFTGGSGCLLVSGTVQQALLELEGYVCSIGAASGGVSSVTAGDGIVLTGGPSNPIVNLLEVGTAGTYGGFQVNEFGQVVGYSAPPAPGLPLDAVSPLHVTQNVSGAYVFTIDEATETAPGVVQLASVGDFVAGNPIAPDHVVSWAFLQEWWNKAKNFICALAVRPALTAVERTGALVPFCLNGVTEAITVRDLVAAAGGAFARVSGYPLSGVMVVEHEDNIAAVNIIGGVEFLVTMSVAAPDAAYHVSVQMYQQATGWPVPLAAVVFRDSPMQFRVRWVDAATGAQVLVTPDHRWSAVVTLTGD